MVAHCQLVQYDDVRFWKYHIRGLLCFTLSVFSCVPSWTHGSAIPEPGYSIERHCSRQRWISWMQIFILLLMNKSDEGGADNGDGGLGHGWVQRDDCSLVFMTNLWWSYGERTKGYLWTSCGCLQRCFRRIFSVTRKHWCHTYTFMCLSIRKSAFIW